MIFIKITDSGDILWIEHATGQFDNIQYNVCCDNKNGNTINGKWIKNNKS